MDKLTKVCIFDFPPIKNFYGYEIQTFDIAKYRHSHNRYGLSELVYGGLGSYLFRNRLYSADGIDRLYRSRDRVYMSLVEDFVESFRDFDVVIMANYNFIHPEVLYHELRKPVKILGFVDDPFSTYLRGIPFLWAFDGAFHVSPSYDDRSWFSERLEKWGCEHSMWWPLRPDRREMPRVSDQFFENRDVDVIYVGRAYGPKIDRLAVLRRHFGKRFHIYGDWPLNGYYGFFRRLAGKPALYLKVQKVNDDERSRLYMRSKIGINMHLSTTPRETGNMRMYEVPEHGALLLSDTAGLNAHELIFRPGTEAVFYSTVDDAIEKLEFYLKNEASRLAIARGGFERVWKDYEWSTVLKMLLDWAVGLREKRHRA